MKAMFIYLTFIYPEKTCESKSCKYDLFLPLFIKLMENIWLV